MKPIHLIPANVRALALCATAMAATQPTPASDAPAQYNPMEVGMDKVQTRRDPAKG